MYQQFFKSVDKTPEYSILHVKIEFKMFFFYVCT